MMGSHAHRNGENAVDESYPDWENSTKESIPQWKKFIDEEFADDDTCTIDWEWLKGLDLYSGIGIHDNDNMFASLSYDYIVRAKMERILGILSKAWMFDHDDIIPDYDLVRALAHASRRLNDDIDYLEDKIPEDRRPSDTAPANESRRRHGGSSANGNDWHERYLPGKDVGIVVGIDLETTGLNQYRDYVIDSGYEKMDMRKPLMADGNHSIYRDSGYTADGAYAQERHSYGLSTLRSSMGNPTEFLTGISSEDLRPFPTLDDSPSSQQSLLAALKSAPYVAHNAGFEHKHFMANVKGYAEAYKNGDITIIDTMCMSIKWGHDGNMKHDNNKLETYAKNWGGLDLVSSERHLGLEDAHIMLLAMNNHLHYLKSSNGGPWDADSGIDGIGGKQCR